jgi:AMMECR1 domain-containing protein
LTPSACLRTCLHTAQAIQIEQDAPGLTENLGNFVELRKISKIDHTLRGFSLRMQASPSKVVVAE